MRLRQEQVVFVAVLLLLGLMSWKVFTPAVTPRGRGGAKTEEFVHHRSPDVALALPDETFAPALAREIFAPPRDTRPLPPLELVEPPRPPLPGLLPPTDPGPAPRYYGSLLRTAVEPADVPELFAALEDGADLGFDEDFFDEEPERDPNRSLIAAVNAANQDPDPDPIANLTPFERELRLAAFRAKYDWFQEKTGSYQWGRIENKDRYALKTDPLRDTEAIMFTRLDPDTGREFFKNIDAPPIAIDRSKIETFEFADNVPNEIEVRRLRIGATLNRTSYEQALQLASYCVRHRLDAARALERAEELYKLCAAFDGDDPLPRLGLALCYESGFEFERAFDEYNRLLAAYPHRAEPYVGLARLEERFLLFDKAEERLRQAVVVDRSSWIARRGLGQFLANRGRHEEAVEHLTQASRGAPQDPEMLHVRVGIRTDLASALFGAGQIDQAHRVFDQALNADPGHQCALAGYLSTQILAPELAQTNGTTAMAEDAGEGAGFELLLARGVAALVNGEFESSRDQLQLAVDADPLRAHVALAALSFLAEITGHPEEALRFAEEALDNNPRDAYALYQKGRLLGFRDDYEGAREALLAALDLELDFEDALVSLGEMAFRLGRFDDADRYFERAIGIGGGRADVHALRGLNFLRLGSVPDARESFDRAIELEPGGMVARAGGAWCTYLSGDPQEAQILLANIDEDLRDQPEEDPYRVWSREQIERLRDHLEKVSWTDNFNRARLVNGWLTDEGSGPEVSMKEGAVRIGGMVDDPEPTYVYREYNAGLFVAFEADVRISATTKARAGIAIVRQRPSRTRKEKIGEASVSRHKEGGTQIRLLRTGRTPEVLDMQQDLPTGEWVRLRIERTGESSDSAVTLYMNGIPLAENMRMAALGSASSPLLVGLFAEGEPGRLVDVEMDNVEVVYRNP